MPTLNDYTDRLAALAGDTPLPDAHWLEHATHGSSESNYCADCVAQVLAYLTGAGPQPAGYAQGEHPTWADCTLANTWSACDCGAHEADGAEFCALCGTLLNVNLTTYGVESELTHYETHGCGTLSNDWNLFQAVVAGIAYVENTNFPAAYTWLKDYQVRQAQALYARLLALLARWFPEVVV